MKFSSDPENTLKSKLLRYFKKNSHPNRTIRQSYNIAQDSRIDEGFQQQKSNNTSCPSLITTATYLSAVSSDQSKKIADFLDALPVELAYLILSYCDEKAVFESTLVSKRWNALCRDNHLWFQLYRQHHGLIYASPASTTATAGDIIDYKYLYERKTQLLGRWKHGQQQMQTIMGHSDSIYCVQFDTNKIVTGSRDRTIKFWSITSQHCYKTLKGHQASVLCLQYDDTILVSGSSDHTLLVWSMKTYQPTRCLRGHTSGVLDVCFDENTIASCSKDATIRTWTRDGKLLQTLMGHRGPVNAIQFRNGRLVSASGDTVIKLWDMETGQCLRDFVGHAHGLACIRFDGKRIVSGSNDNRIKVWNADTGECILTCEGHTGLVRSLHFDKNKIVSGSYDQSIRVWDIQTGECLHTFARCHTSWVFDVMFDETKIIRQV
ncbi:hypothetical protein [Parasitella parasitica]|uniref:F-box domain-containing protein n=1 Tax=Parasitella parasitica TaxID=35722 RepID=A0A0B7N512_9FUNG|nr:hypothetical protein [Parasitella parasitica]